VAALAGTPWLSRQEVNLDRAADWGDEATDVAVVDGEEVLVELPQAAVRITTARRPKSAVIGPGARKLTSARGSFTARK
jgi:hypothetical protein